MFKRFFLILLTSAVLIVALSAFLLFRPLLSKGQQSVEFIVSEGESSSLIVQNLQEKDIPVPDLLFKVVARLTGLDTRLKAGGYELEVGDSTWTLLSKLRRGEFSQVKVRFIEGWTLKNIRNALAKNPKLTHTLQTMSNDALAQYLGIDGPYLEGMFFPDTYVFPKGTKDIDILKAAHHQLQQRLTDVWEHRSSSAQVKTPYELLILASIIEKETGKHSDRERIAGVFNNRLRIGMRLQTDPTVIYGLGSQYAGRLRKAHLRDASNPWNTYTIPALPPSPIAVVGMQSLKAAANPEQHGYLYFVATGDGGSAFSKNLNEHNSNVNRYILGK